MRFDENEKKEIKKWAFIIFLGMLMYFIPKNFSTLLSGFRYLWGIVFPFILGLCFAFIISMPMNFIERKVLKFWKPKKKGGKRAISIILALILIIGVVTVVIYSIGPQLITSINSIFTRVPGFMEKLSAELSDVEWVQDFVPALEDWWKNNMTSIQQKVIDFIENEGDTVFGNVVGTIQSIFSGFVNFFMAAAFSMYVLMNKEKLIRQSRELLYAIMEEEHADRIQYVLRIAHKNFYNFFTGQFLEAMALGFMSFVGMTILQIPNALALGVLQAFSALIPIVGPVLGAILTALILLMYSPVQALVYIIFIIILQQIDGNFVYPKIVGKQVGLSPMWVLVAITVGGAMMGVVGMLIFVPIFSTVFTIIYEFKERRLKQKDIDIEEKEKEIMAREKMIRTQRIEVLQEDGDEQPKESPEEKEKEIDELEEQMRKEFEAKK